MQTIIGVKFRNTSKIYYFDPKGLDIHYNDHVIVETVRGIEYGTVVLSPMELEDEKVPQPLKDVIRIATELDTEREAENRVKEKEAYRICKEKIAERGLEMKLIQAEYTFDNSKVLFYFTADGRIDFRDLVKELASIFRTRIELRQIGVRDETKILGGMGICGRPLCCHTYLTEFVPVSIKMAKEQNLSLNPSKISGCCGRLMCCLKNEADTYTYLSKGLPAKGDQMTTPDGRHGEVVSIDILRQRVKCVVDIDNDEKEMQEYAVSEISFIPHSKRPKGQANQPKSEKKAKKDAPVNEPAETWADTAEEVPETRRNGDGTEGKNARKNHKNNELPAAEGAEQGERRNRRRDKSANREAQAENEGSGENTQGRKQRPRKAQGAAEQTTGAEGAERPADGQEEPVKTKRRRRRSHPRKKSTAE